MPLADLELAAEDRFETDRTQIMVINKNERGSLHGPTCFAGSRAVLGSAVGIVGELVRSCPDGLLLDVAMPGLSGIEAAEQIRRRQLCTPILMVTMHADPTYAIRALSAGASGYVLKTAAPDELILAIRKVLAGGTYVASPIARAVEEACAQEGKLDPLATVTRRQRIVLRLAAAGWTAREIGSLLGTPPAPPSSTNTVRWRFWA